MKEEIKSTDVMIGNWVDFNGEKARITQLWDLEAIFKCGDSALYSEISGILITEDTLLESGFKKDVNGIVWIKITPDRHLELIHSEEVYYPQLAQTPEMSCESINVVSLKKIQSLHELQNLFKTLTGNDLNIKL